MSRKKKASPPPRQSPDGLFRAAVLLTVCAALAVGVANIKGKPPRAPTGARLAKSSERPASQRPSAPVRTAFTRPPERAAGPPTRQAETSKEERRGKISWQPPAPEAKKPRPAQAHRPSPSPALQDSREAPRRGPSPAAAGPPPTPPAARPADRAPAKEAPRESELSPPPPAQQIIPPALTPEGRQAALRRITLPPGFTAEIKGGKPNPRLVANNEVARGNPKYHRVALTFDADGDSRPIPTLLDVLQSKQVKATFFLTGRWAERNPDLVRRIHREGHELANHSYSHPHLPTLEEEELLEEVARTGRLFYQLTGQAPSPYVRFPYGDRNINSLRLLIRQGYLPVYWSLDSHDWMESVTEADILKRVVEQAQPGDIILLHATTAKTARVLPQLLAELSRKGLACGTVSSVLVP